MKYIIGNNNTSWMLAYLLKETRLILHKTLEELDYNAGPHLIQVELLDLVKQEFDDVSILDFERFYSDRGKLTSIQPKNFGNLYSLYTRGKTITEEKYKNNYSKYQKYVSINNLGPEDSYDLLFEKIKEFYTLNSAHTESEHVEGGYVTIADTGADGSGILQLPEALRMEIHLSLRPVLEDWSKTQLVPTFVYGIRTYKRGAILVGHRDRIDTHIISAIINIDQEVEEGWPLMVEDHYYRDHHVLLQPGEVVFYESARLLHGRPIPLKGNKFANIFCHFKPL